MANLWIEGLSSKSAENPVSDRMSLECDKNDFSVKLISGFIQVLESFKNEKNFWNGDHMIPGLPGVHQSRKI